ncbi:hypothetical protein [Ammoniphilus sp. CFH 90114]|uniref:hypothetical protein n=1 Tax=Ammoniphilus sp. CFH 90114 TaxID=2493665 RepID=UPI00100FF3E4|nr:hypothetical protein [Ammoniphilus sp. CFH 90114]RXT15038.1 hypothetical protein EIZ39_02185 [Ammoniphilus sp. CFH 90114]
MKKWIISIGALAILGFAGYKIGMNYVSEKMMDQVTQEVLTPNEVKQLLDDPVIQQAIEEHGGTQALEQMKKQAPASVPEAPVVGQEQPAISKPASASPSLLFSTREEAMKFLLTKFTLNELSSLASKAQGGLTSEEKEEIKQTLLSRLSPEEFQALKILGLIELSKK